jgi:chromosome segregation ATPase
MSDAPATRIATLEGEAARLRDQHASDADQIAEMLVRVAASERAKHASERQAAEAEVRAEVLLAELNHQKSRVAELEAFDPKANDAAFAELRKELEAARSAHARTQEQLGAAREAMGNAMALLEDLERREEMVSGVRRRAIDQMKKSLGSSLSSPQHPAASPPPRPQPPPLPEQAHEAMGQVQPTPIRSVPPMKPLREGMAEPEPYLELDLSE